MKARKKVLASVLITVQSVQTHIRSVMDACIQPELRTVLQEQLHELDDIETETHRMAFQRGWELNELDPFLRFWMDRKIRIKITGRHKDSRIAGLMIQCNTDSMIRSLRKLKQAALEDETLKILFQKLLDCERAHIRLLQNYL
ncbi:MAG: hypothetical protein J6V25_13230 [Oscillospiraceae bacterium]|nr:hypothetical protein [Oscillospiraceae bacterium]